MYFKRKSNQLSQLVEQIKLKFIRMLACMLKKHPNLWQDMNSFNIEQIQNITTFRIEKKKTRQENSSYIQLKQEETTTNYKYLKILNEEKELEMPLIAATCMSWHNLDDECIIACKLFWWMERMNEKSINLRWLKIEMVWRGVFHHASYINLWWQCLLSITHHLKKS